MFNRLEDFYEPFLEWSRESGKANVTLKEYRRMFRGPLKKIGGRRLRNLRLTDMSCIQESGDLYGKYSVEKSMVTIRQLFRYIRDSGENIPFEWRDIKCSKVPRPPVEYLHPDEISKLRAVMDTSTQNGLRTRALFELLLHTGLRIGEGVSLNITDVDYAAREACVTNVKNKKSQKVFLTENCIYWLKEYLRTRKDDLPYLFVAGRRGSSARRLLPVTARAALTKYEKLSELEKHVHWHILRKTFVTNLLFGGVDIKTTQHLARHESEVTTLRHYAAVNHEKARGQAMRVMESV